MSEGNNLVVEVLATVMYWGLGHQENYILKTLRTYFRLFHSVITGIKVLLSQFCFLLAQMWTRTQAF